MILAAYHTGGSAIVVIIVGLIKLLSWLAEQKKGAPKSRSAADAEAERTRRFLEALGQAPAGRPAADIAAPMRQKVPARQATRREERPLPAPLPPARFPVPPPLHPRRPVPAWNVPPPPELSPLATRAVTEFQTKAGRVSAFADDRRALPDANAAKPDDPGAAMRALLASAGGMRTAFLLREVLGPPRGLPGSPTGPTLSAS